MALPGPGNQTHADENTEPARKRQRTKLHRAQATTRWCHPVLGWDTPTSGHERPRRVRPQTQQQTRPTRGQGLEHDAAVVSEGDHPMHDPAIPIVASRESPQQGDAVGETSNSAGIYERIRGSPFDFADDGIWLWDQDRLFIHDLLQTSSNDDSSWEEVHECGHHEVHLRPYQIDHDRHMTFQQATTVVDGSAGSVDIDISEAGSLRPGPVTTPNIPNETVSDWWWEPMSRLGFVMPHYTDDEDLEHLLGTMGSNGCKP
ncbi:uncharacterized protein PV06_05423 [Exophiala oligosperma]|uniref:Uncharacterized protein n=1 Tax=Exophiala oligosperma TaxID=215243 RepID=A0A0D2APC0_9EURO|nr:uncharacterized protein PV06_05423 [Exophiala oligosperma]KIW41816.1 hypothetical protein PV06_05423 [Exophiala oligosperma]